MRFRAKLLLGCSMLSLLLCAGTNWVIHRSVNDEFEQSDRQAFAGISRGFRLLYRDRTSRLRQACELIINIPDLRALIAEQNFELTLDNQLALRDRLDSLRPLVGSDFVIVLDQVLLPIAVTTESPWDSLEQLQDFLLASQPACALLDNAIAADVRGHHGLWAHQGQLYQVVAVPLIFRSSSHAHHEAEGLLVVGQKITDQHSVELGQIHDCLVSFVVEDVVSASSLTPSNRFEMLEACRHYDDSQEFISNVGGQAYRGVIDPLVDPNSGDRVGSVVIQHNQSGAQRFLRRVRRNLGATLVLGLASAALFSMLFSSAVTRPINELLSGVRRVARGDLNLAVRARSRDELGELAIAFNDMVTQVRCSRHQLQNTNEQLELRVEARTRQLSVMNEDLCREVAERRNAENQLAAANRAKSDFLANMSHEIRTPMTAIIGFAEQMMEDPAATEQQARYLQTIRRNGHHLLELINDILDLSKVEAGKLEVDNAPCHPVQLVSDVTSLMQVRADERGIDFFVDFESPIPEVIHSDAMRLRQILVNFIGNAIKFTDTGSVSLKVRLIDQRLADDTLETAGPVQLPAIFFQVLDTGIGLSAEQIERIFDPFTQADESTTRQFGGTGLGLTICRRLAELLHGSISVTSRLGEGSCFTLLVPTGPLDATALIKDPIVSFAVAGTDNRPTAVSLPACRILLAEDRPENRELVSFALRKVGADVELAENGQVAINKIVADAQVRADSRTPFDLVLMDMQMPVIDGYQATQILRGKGYTMPIIALTAHAMKGDREKCLSAGCSDHVTKPIDMTHLLRTISRHLAGDSTLDEHSPIVTETIMNREEGPRSPADALDYESLLRRCLGNAELAESLLSDFANRAGEKMKEIEHSINLGDTSGLAKLAHGLKGVAANLGAIGLSNTAAHLENLAQSDQLDIARDCLQQLQSDWHNCLHLISTKTFSRGSERLSHEDSSCR